MELLLRNETACSECLRPLWLFLYGNANRGLKKMEEAGIAFDACIKSCEDQPETSGWVSSAWSNLSSVYEYLKKTDKAVKCIETAIEKSPPDRRSQLHRILGILYSAAYDADSAIREYEKALSLGDEEIAGDICARLGHQQLKKREFEAASLSYEAAINSPCAKELNRVFNNLGYCRAQLADFRGAVQAFCEAAHNFQDASCILDIPHFNLARAYVDSVEYKSAQSELDRVISCRDFSSEVKARAIRMAQLLRENASGVSEFKELCPYKTLGSEATVTPEELVKIKLSGAKIEAYDAYRARSVKGGLDKSALTILRDWCCALPLLNGSTHQLRGGGYFLQWNGVGVVIDPGFDFLLNFHDAGFLATQINHVVVSHNHTDHNHDLRSLDDLMYEIGKREVGRKAYGVWTDTDTKRNSQFKESRHRSGPEVLNGSQRLEGAIVLDSKRVKHTVKGARAVRFRLETPDDGTSIIVGYTGDTEWFPGLGKFLRGCDILVAHISQPKDDELLDPDSGKFRKSHLGYLGVCELLKSAKPKMALIGEFWGGLADVRLDLVRAIRARTGLDCILPAAVGLRVLLPQLMVECGRCLAPTDPRNIRVVSGSGPGGSLEYRCRDCVI